LGGDEQSGEALKQREIGLLGKIGRAQVQIGNSWEDLAYLSARVQNAFGTQKAPEIVEANTRWKDAQIRNDAEIINSANWYWQNGFLREALRVMSQSSLANHTEKDIERLLAERRTDAADDMNAKAQTVPGFGQFAPLEVSA
jgi:predicted Zn-dependent protease